MSRIVLVASAMGLFVALLLVVPWISWPINTYWDWCDRKKRDWSRK